ncbi:hypothetical protein BDF20DRAFT_917963 [Mycotypha africana]|uniref:uncharacterized protein n=1 Tax=Mycotypha africana TaxID=64632 RepID=UPI002300DF33|nr:uncharacterized protein BDF20DRAFT_917963 [Mycotypha africana]KAI8967012.1 hypothetical protein BDF20DRAFT_917963 [Mycotypha africana]
MNNAALFGGAIVAPVPKTFVDASQFRQIPDNQEVFVDMNTQQSLIFELLEEVDAHKNEIPKFHFQQLAEDNEATDATVISIEKLQPESVSSTISSERTEIYILQGEQKIAKFNEEGACNTVEIFLAVVRLTQVATDFVISINAPVSLAPGSSEQKSINQSNSVTNIATVKQEIKAIVEGLQIKDWGLFQ